MSQYYRLLSDTKQQYARILQDLRHDLEARLCELRGHYRCDSCESGSAFQECWLESLHPGCGYRAWQKQVLVYLDQEVGRDILQTLQRIEAFKNTFTCHMCGICCRLASSEHTYEQLQARAEDGDEFARQFTRVFLPYESREQARARYPDVVAAVLAEAGEEPGDGERVHFYHCPYIGEDNRCTIYGTEKRPDICASYPETPLSFVYEKCAWKPWKDETHPETLSAHALLALCSRWTDKLKAALA